jgi:hypothetical protein
MQGPEALRVVDKGEIIFPDVAHPLPIRIVMLLAFAWVFFGPMLVFLGTRRRRTRTALARYAVGVVAATGVLMAIQWGMPTPDLKRFSVLWTHLAGPMLALGTVLGGLAYGLARVSRPPRNRST